MQVLQPFFKTLYTLKTLLGWSKEIVFFLRGACQFRKTSIIRLSLYCNLDSKV